MNRLKTQLGTLSLVLAMLFGYVATDEDYNDFSEEELISNANRKSRGLRVGERIYKLFEFAPSDGVGMTDVCPLPNWALQSEAFDTATWNKGSGAVAAPTVTANQFADPVTGAVTADRIQIPATPTGWSAVYQTAITECTVGPCTYSVWVYGNNTNTFISIGMGTATPVIWDLCNIVQGAWSQCSISGAGTSIWLGALGTWSLDALDAIDVYATRVMVNVGSTSAPYFATTTVAANAQPTTARGQTLSASRASAAYCNSNTDATLNTGILTGSLIKYPNNMIRVERGSNGIKGIRSEHGITNFLTYSQAIGSPGWSAASSVAGIATTADSAAAPDGTITADTWRFPATSGVNYSVVYQLTGSALSTPGCSVYAKAVAPLDGGVAVAGTFDISCGGTCGTCTYTADGKWNRCFVQSAAGSATQYMYIGNYTQVCGVTRAAQDVALWQAQMEVASGYPTSPFPTAAAIGTRIVDTLQYDLGVTAPAANTMCVAASISGKPVAAAERDLGAINVASDAMGGTSGKGMWLYSAAASGSTMRCIAMDDASTLYATSSVTGGSGNVNGYCSISGNTVVGTWAGNVMTASGAISGGTWSPARYITLSGQTLGNADAIKYGFVVDTAANGCQ